MACYHPISAWHDRATGSVDFYDRGRGDRIDLPCGRCVGCRLERSRQWATRIMLEAKSHDLTSFLTLTYSDDALPHPPSLHYKHYQDFMKRLRRRTGRPVRFFMCGEYGSNTFRPHYHACIFGEDFSSDRYLWSVTSAGHPLYRSPMLEELWPHGNSLIGNLSFESAAYVARYILKKVTGDLAADHYAWTDPDTGEVHDRVPEFCRMSLKPGIGATWYDKYKSDVITHDTVVINGVATKPPRYFDKLLKRADPLAMEDAKDMRAFEGLGRKSDNTTRRLADREEVTLAALNRNTYRS